MLEPVALNQNRFNAPGIAPDSRGIALGKQGAVLFASVDALVGWFRILSDEIPLDDLLPSLLIHEVKSALQSLSFVVAFHAESSYLLDRASRIAGLLGGLAFTGAGKHFVKYRDGQSPLGYDIDALSSDAGDYVLYGDSFTQAYRRVRDIPFSQLVFRLSLRRLPGNGAGNGAGGGFGPSDHEHRGTLWLAVAPGLSRGVLEYLWRNRVQVAAAMVEREGGRSSFGNVDGSFPPRYLLAKVTDLPLRMLALFEAVPGIAVYRPATEQAIVEVGFRHPLQLESCRSIFEKDRFYVFSGRRDAVDVIAQPIDSGQLLLVDGERLIKTDFDLGHVGAPPPLANTVPPAPVAIALKLVPSTAPPRRVVAALLGWRELEQLKRLVFALPPTVLAGCVCAPIDDGILVVGAAGADAIPLGEPFYEAAPSILVPLGMEFLPRVSEAILAEHVGGVDGKRVVFRRGAARPIAIEESAFEPLSRRMLGRIEPELRQRSERAGTPQGTSAAAVVNDPLGPFPLWGYRSPRGSGE